MPWKFESSYPHHGFGVVAQLIERYVRIVEVVGLSPISSTKIKKNARFGHFFIKPLIIFSATGRCFLLETNARYDKILGMKQWICLTLILEITAIPAVARATPEFNGAVQQALQACRDISREFDDMKKMAGINTGITAVGTAAGGGAVAVGFSKQSIDRQIAELERQICDDGGCDADSVGAMTQADFFNKVLGPMAQIAELQRLNVKSKKLGNWRTGLLAGNTATNIAGAVIAGKNRIDKTTREIVDDCVTAINDLGRAITQARADNVDADKIAYANDIVEKCSAWEYVNLDKVDRRANGAMWSSIAGGTVGAAGIATSAVANSDTTRNDNSIQGKKHEQNLNTASNVLAIGATAASATATVFNATQIAAIKRAVEAADACEAALGLEFE